VYHTSKGAAGSPRPAPTTLRFSAPNYPLGSSECVPRYFFGNMEYRLDRLRDHERIELLVRMSGDVEHTPLPVVSIPPLLLPDTISLSSVHMVRWSECAHVVSLLTNTQLFIRLRVGTIFITRHGSQSVESLTHTQCRNADWNALSRYAVGAPWRSRAQVNAIQKDNLIR